MKLFQNSKICILLLLGIFLIALFLRVHELGVYPSGFHIDEASLGYNGYSMLKTGRDESGAFLPLYIDMFGDNRPTGYHYLTILPVALFGLTEFATRLPAAIFGALCVFAIYFLSAVIFSEKKDLKWIITSRTRRISLAVAFLLAISPWHFVLSRASAEAVVALFFILIGFGFVLRSFKTSSIRDVIIGSFLLSVSFFFYHTPRVFVPLLYFVLTIFFLKDIFNSSKKNFKKAVVILFLSLTLLSALLIFVIAGGVGRFSQVNIFSHPETRLILEEQFREDGIQDKSLLQTRIAHNKVVNYSLTFVSNYFEYFSGDFLFVKGGLPKWYVIDKVGLFYIMTLPFMLYGLFLVFRKNNRFLKAIVIWLLVSPVVAAITTDDIPNVNRAIVMLPMLELLSAFGFVILLEKKIWWSRALLIIFVLGLIGNFYYVMHQYFVHGAVHRPWYRNDGFKPMIETIKKDYDSYDNIIVTKSAGGIYPLVLFYMEYDPLLYQKEGSTKDVEYTGFGKFYFVPQDCPSVNLDRRFPKEGKTLFVNSGVCPDMKNIIQDDYFRKDGTRVFRLQIINYEQEDQ